MFQRLVVPIDGSKRSWDAAVMASMIGEACDADVELVMVVEEEPGVADAVADLGNGIEAHQPWARVPSIHAFVPRPSVDDSIGAVLGRYAERVDGSMIVMSSSGRGRSAAVLGSVADDLLRTSFGPIIVLGPNADPSRPFVGDIVVPVDGSEFSERSLPLAAAWGIALGATPWVVEVLQQPIPSDGDLFESAYLHRLSADLEKTSHHDVEFEVLHGPSVSDAITDFADLRDARFVLLSTHGRGGLERLTVGSVAADVVHRSKCPVVLHRPPKFSLDG